jgi:hypothetical protein
MAEIDAKLAAALKQARKTPMNFALVAKGSNAGKLVLSKKKLTATEVSAAKKEAGGGGTVFRGRCVGEEGKLIFELAKEPPATLDKQLRTIITKEAGLTLKVEARRAPDLVDEGEGDSATAPDGAGQAGAEAPSGAAAFSDGAATPGAPAPGAPAPGAPAPAAPKASGDMKLKETVSKRLSALADAYTAAVRQKGADTEKMQALFSSLKKYLDAQDFEQVARILDQMEPIAGFLAKKTATEKKIAELEKHPHAAHFARSIATSKTKVQDAVKLAAAPAHDYAGALSALKIAEAALGQTEKMFSEYKRVLDDKADTEKKIARLGKLQHNKFITGEIAAIKQQQAAALALAEPPGHKYVEAMKELGEVAKACAAAEVKILDKATSAMRKDRTALRAFLKHTFKQRFGINLDLEAKGDTPEQEYEAAKRMYELMARVPESHTNRNPALEKVERIGGTLKSQGGKYDDLLGVYYPPWFKVLGKRVGGDKVKLRIGRPSDTTTQQLQDGLTNSANVVDPPVDPECEPVAGKGPQNYFDWTTLHEIAHAVDDRRGFMNDKTNAAIASWKDYGSDVSQPAIAAAAHFHLQSADGVEYIKQLMEGKYKSRPKKKPPVPKGADPAKWATAITNVGAWVDSIREDSKPWDHLPDAIGDLVYHEAYAKNWVSYRRDARKQAITGYQFRSRYEWFAELYAAYHMGVLQDRHPLVKRFLRDF